MATRAELAREEEERKRSAAKRRAAAKAAKARAAKAPPAREKTHKETKATYAVEPPHEGKPSRKSTRKSANRSKSDTNFNLRESLQKGSPEARARRSRAKAVRTRGS